MAEKEPISGRFGHGLGPRPVRRPPPEAPATPDEPSELSAAQKRSLAIVLITLGAVSIGTVAIVQAIDRRHCEADPERVGCDHRSSGAGSGGSGGSGYGGGGSGHTVSFGGFGGTGAAHGGGGS